MQSIPFHIAYLLTQYECVILPGFGAFIVSLSDKEKTNRWGILSPPVNSLEFDTEIKHDDGLLANSIEEDRQCSYNEARTLLNKYVTQISNILDNRKSVHIPWVGILYRKNNKILFQAEKILSCNAINYGLTGFSLPYVEDLRREAATLPKQNKAPGYLKQSSVVTPPRQNVVPTLPKQNNAIIHPQDNKKEVFSVAKNRRTIIYAGLVVAFIAMILIPISLKNGHFHFSLSKPPANIVQMPTWDPHDDEADVSEAETQIPEESTDESEIEQEVEPAIKPATQPAAKPKTQPTTKPIPQSTAKPTREPATKPKVEETKLESNVTKTETPVNNPRPINNNREASSYYYIIVGSWPNEVYAKNAQAEFHLKGFRDTGILYEDKKYRIYVNRFENRGEAEKFLIQFRQDNSMYENAWILKQ